MGLISETGRIVTCFKNLYFSPGRWWLTPVIPAIWEAEIGRIEAQGQPWQTVPETPSLK
jgi:hypothetical protein